MSRDVPGSARKPSPGAAPFHVVLEQLRGREGPSGAETFRSPATSAFDPAYAAPQDSFRPFGAGVAELYADADDATAVSAETPRSIVADVALELQLQEALEPADLERLRRRFAYRNHPDRVPPALKGRALERMTIANVLIDQALKAARERMG